MSTCRSAVLFLIFNRPTLTARVFAAIRAAKPARLYVAADGPRPDRNTDADLCQRTREEIRVDWPCEVKTHYRSNNLGCRRAVSEAITWFFEHEEEGIILEDDCRPNDSFFPYCDTLLERYRDDPRVMSINGSCYSRPIFLREPYAFTYYADPWGWATWRRAWRKYDGAMTLWSEERGALEAAFPDNPHVVAYWARVFDDVASGRIGTWDYQWIWTVIYFRGVVASPCRNMIKNIGFSEDATHTKQFGHLAVRRCEPLKMAEAFPLIMRSEELELDLHIARLGVDRRACVSSFASFTIRWLHLEATTYFFCMSIMKIMRLQRVMHRTRRWIGGLT